MSMLPENVDAAVAEGRGFIDSHDLGVVDDADQEFSSDIGSDAGARLWNDDPRLRRILPLGLLPSQIGVVELGTYYAEGPTGQLLLGCAQQLADELARQDDQTLEEAARDILTQADETFHDSLTTSHRRIDAPCGDLLIDVFLRRLGLVGAPPITLEEAGQLIGRTRERFRQLQRSHAVAFSSTRPSWPQLDRALNLVVGMAPCTEGEFSTELLKRASALFSGRTLDVDEVDGAIGTSSSEGVAVLSAAKKTSSRSGLATLLQISDEVVEEGWIVSEEQVRAILSASRGVVWLDEHHVTVETVARNRLVNTLRVLLSVHQPVGLERALAAIADFWFYRNAGRSSGRRSLVPPSIAGLRAFCRWHPDFAVVGALGGEAIASLVELDYRTELGVEAAMLLELIRSTPDEATDRLTLLDAAEAVGMKVGTVGTYLTYHPAFTSPAHNVWTVLGTEVPATAIEEIQREANARSALEARDFNVGGDNGGRRWVALSVTSTIRMSGVLLKRWLPSDTASQRLQAIDGRGDPCGTIVYNSDSGFSHGFGSYFRRHDVPVGRCLLVVADLEWETAQVIDGGRELLDGPPNRSS
jgi:hypothetical protein